MSQKINHNILSADCLEKVSASAETDRMELLCLACVSGLNKGKKGYTDTRKNNLSGEQSSVHGQKWFVMRVLFGIIS